jgi:phospho-N-acetylmuramoyl-pentapeptide-transferase
MLYYIFDFLDKHYNIPGAGVFQYISFRSAMALVASLIISLIFGKRIIGFIQKQQIGESIRDLVLYCPHFCLARLTQSILLSC